MTPGIGKPGIGKPGIGKPGIGTLPGILAAGVLSTGVLATSACADPREPLDLDAILEPELACVTVVHPDLELGGEVHRYIGDASASPGGWALVSVVENNQEQLAMIRLPASDDEPATDPVFLGLIPSDADAVTIRGGASEGELWVLIDRGSVSVQRLVPGFGELARNDSLTNFPGTEADGGACPSAFSRVLLLGEGQPYVLALPNCSDTPALTLHLLALERETLSFQTSWQLAFDPCANFSDAASCAEVYAYSLSDISVGTTTSLPEVTRIPVGFTQVRAFTGGLGGPAGGVLSSDVSLLDMRLTADGPQARLVTFREVWIHGVPIALGPVALAQDPYATLLQVRNQTLDDDVALMRFDTIGDFYVQLSRPELLPFLGHGTLVQIGNQGVILDRVDDSLRAVPLLDIDSWPSWTERELLVRDQLLGFEPAGPDQLLLRHQDAAAEVVRISCSKGED